jgi:nicotinamide mononucleotide transporter
MEVNTVLEILGTSLGLVFLILIIKEQKAGWLFGIAGSLVSIFLFYRIKLYSESILYIYYVLIGIYGYYIWNKKDNSQLKVTNWNTVNHLLILAIGVVFALLLGFVFDNYTDANNAYLDAFTTTFSFIASYMEAKKILSAWLFWIVINGVTIGLYLSKDLDIYSLLTLIYFVSSFVGYFSWKKKLKIA